MADKTKVEVADQDDIDLEALFKEVTSKIDSEKQAERSRKIRYVFDQLGRFEGQIRKNENERKKLLDKRDKCAAKLQEIRKGGPNALQMLDSINPDSKDDNQNND